MTIGYSCISEFIKINIKFENNVEYKLIIVIASGA